MLMVISGRSYELEDAVSHAKENADIYLRIPSSLEQGIQDHKSITCIHRWDWKAAYWDVFRKPVVLLQMPELSSYKSLISWELRYKPHYR